MAKSKLPSIGFMLIPVATVILLILAIAFARESSKISTLTIAAGASSGDSYLICQALKAVAEEKSPRLKLTVLETAGTVENFKLLEAGKADVATAQADVDPSLSARSVAILFDDVFQLLIHDKSGITGFTGLRGKKIGLSPGGGQFDSFLRVATHFNLSQSDFQFVGTDDHSAEQAFAAGKADALFRVRALGNPSIQHLVEAGNVRILSIGHAAAMKIKHAGFDSAVIPAGAYQGEPPVPEADLPTIAVHRLLLAREGADPAAIRALTGLLIENRQAIMNQLPESEPTVRQLLAQTRRPQPGVEFCPALHPGAASYYDKDKPNFIQAHADFVGLLITVIVMIGSWVWQIKGWMERRQKNNADEYTNRVVALMRSAETAKTVDELAEVRGQMLTQLSAAVCDLDADKLSESSFNSFRAVLQIAIEVARERRDMLAPTVAESHLTAIA